MCFSIVCSNCGDSGHNKLTCQNCNHETLKDVAEKLQSTKQLVEEELERVNAEKVSLQTHIVQQRDQNEKLKEALELSKDQHLVAHNK